MTREQYIANIRPDEYIGKHELKNYNIWRVQGPAGPQERFSVCGLEKAAEYTLGCWDYSVTDMNGKDIPMETLSYYRRKVMNNVEHS